jgi:small subunit ribosomal protein S1
MGVRVQLQDGSEALLREREIFWEPEKRRDWRKYISKDDEFPVIVLERGKREETEVSKRLAERDPWKEVLERYPLGSVHFGQVAGIESYGAFIRLEPGVTGLLHRDNWAEWMKQARGTSHYFWIGDEVFVRIHQIDIIHRRISFSMKDLSQHRWCEDIFVFSLEGCVAQGFLSRLQDFDWEEPLVMPTAEIQQVELMRKGLRGALWAASHPFLVLGGFVLSLLLLKRLLRK